ncbi:MAG: hypothetical protein OXH83_09395 [Bryobacterales bacterium]|nr:hypothetical protein [Bryobacterales bacterium]
MQTVLAVALATAVSTCWAQPYAKPYRMVEGWAKLPEGRSPGAIGDVVMDPAGRSLWAVIRCDAGPGRFGYEYLEGAEMQALRGLPLRRGQKHGMRESGLVPALPAGFRSQGGIMDDSRKDGSRPRLACTCPASGRSPS